MMIGVHQKTLALQALTDITPYIRVSSGSEYFDDSSDEDGIPFSPPSTEEQREELDSTRELQVSEQAATVASSDSINEVSITANSKDTKEAWQAESKSLSVFEMLGSGG